MPTPLPRASYRLMIRAGFGWVGGSGLLPGPRSGGAASAAPPLRALRTAIPLRLPLGVEPRSRSIIPN